MAVSKHDVWEYYQNQYGGVLSEQEFNHLYNSVYLRLNSLIFGRAIPHEMEQAFMQAFCELVDYRNLNRPAIGGAGSIEEETIDGYKVKYRNDSDTAKDDAEAQIAQYYLSFPVNLMYCGVVRKNEDER